MWPRGRSAAVRFHDAVPARRDRRELRHHLREVLRATRKEQARALTGELERLAGLRAAVARASPVAAKGRTAIEFLDGTELALRIRDSSFDLERIPSGFERPIARLEGVEPCFGHGWYRLHFQAPGHGRLDMLAKVMWPVTPTVGRTSSAGSSAVE